MGELKRGLSDKKVNYSRSSGNKNKEKDKAGIGASGQEAVAFHTV